MKNIKKMYPLGGMILVTTLMLIGILLILFVGEVPIYLFGVFVIGVGLYCWYGYICNVLIKPKEKVLYLDKVEDNEYFFINEKGKKISYKTKSKKKYETDKFYVVLKTKDYILNILREADTTFMILEGKDNYFLNCYLPVGEFKGIFLLPVIYFIAIFSFLMIEYQNTINFNSIIMFVLAVYLIIYDFIYKRKKKFSITGEVHDQKMKESFVWLINGIKIVTISLICLILIGLLIILKNFIARLVFLPFVLCALSLFGQTIAMIKHNEKLVKFFSNCYIVVFFIYWFGIILACSYVAIRDRQYNSFIALIPLFLIGLGVIYMSFFKKRR